ncbi:MAG TPA: hypothetical protein VGI39_40715 [Polyangiaceae bacterium]|jgi:hypothetical protein
MKDERRSSRPGDVAPQAADDDEEVSESPPRVAARKSAAPRNSSPPKSRKSKPAPRKSSTPPPPSVRSRGKTPKPPPSRPSSPADRPSRGADAPRKAGASGHRIDVDSEEFFAQGDRGEHAEAPNDHPAQAVRRDAHDLDSIPPPPTAPPERVKAMQRWVTITVVVCAGLLLIAIGRLTVSSSRPAVAPAPTAVAEVPQAAAPPTVAAAAVPIPPPPPASPIPPVPDPAASAPVASASAAPAEPGKTAEEERKDAQHSLEHGKAKDAVEAALRSVQLDPTDASAWLLLGASYLELGKGADARAAFTSCTKEAKKGPVVECRSMLR